MQSRKVPLRCHHANRFIQLCIDVTFSISPLLDHLLREIKRHDGIRTSNRISALGSSHNGGAATCRARALCKTCRTRRDNYNLDAGGALNASTLQKRPYYGLNVGRKLRSGREDVNAMRDMSRMSAPTQVGDESRSALRDPVVCGDWWRGNFKWPSSSWQHPNSVHMSSGQCAEHPCHEATLDATRW